MFGRKFTRTVALDRSDVLWVVIPCRNEELFIEDCLNSFLNQTDPNYTVVLVDNGSTDRTREVVHAWKRRNPLINLELLGEETLGTGPACIAGCTYALSHGAKMLARTDGDSIVDRHWVAEAKVTLVSGYDFVAGRLKGRPDEVSWQLVAKTLIVMFFIRSLVVLDRICKKKPPSTILMSGGNMALTAELYHFVGGFTPLLCNEDVDLNNRILEVTQDGIQNNTMVVFTSLRRIKEQGILGTLAWYIKKAKDSS